MAKFTKDEEQEIFLANQLESLTQRFFQAEYRSDMTEQENISKEISNFVVNLFNYFQDNVRGALEFTELFLNFHNADEKLSKLILDQVKG